MAFAEKRALGQVMFHIDSAEVAMIIIGGQRRLIIDANFSPSMEPGICISVNTTVTSKRVSRIEIAWSAVPASTTSKPAATIISAAFKRIRESSSTISRTGNVVMQSLVRSSVG
jgi:hypothetical protein